MNKSLCDPQLWKGLRPNVLYSLNDDCEVYPNEGRAGAIYTPANDVPAFVLCRTSTSDKRMDKGLEVRAEVIESDVAVYTLMAGNSPAGVLAAVDKAVFNYAHRTPDGVHFVRKDPLNEEPVIGSIFAYKTFRSFRIYTPSDPEVFDVIMTAKTRWFRKRNDPKALGFSKDKL